MESNESTVVQVPNKLDKLIILKSRGVVTFIPLVIRNDLGGLIEEGKMRQESFILQFRMFYQNRIDYIQQLTTHFSAIIV